MSHSVMPAAVPATFRGALRAVAYSRVSTEEQKRGYGIAAQNRKNLRHVEAKSWRLVGIFPDEGVSGTLEIQDRPEGRKVMEMAERNEFDVLVVPKGDRIGRVGRAFWRWVWALEDRGIFVALAEKGIDNTTAEGRAQMRREADYAETEWETIRDRTQGGRQEKAEEGGWIGGPPPFGWLIENKGEKGESRLGIDPRAVDITMRTIAILRDGKGWRTAAQRLNLKEELRTRSGKPWSADNLRGRILSEPMLYGYVTFRDPNGGAKVDRGGNPIYGESVRIPVPTFLSEEDRLFLKSLKEGLTRQAQAEASTYFLTGRIFGQCGNHYNGRGRDTARNVRSYRCHGQTERFPGAKKCSDASIDAPLIEETIWSAIVRSFSDPDELKRLAGEWVGTAQTDTSVHAERIADLDRQIEGMNSAISSVMVAVAKSGGSPEAIAEAKSTLETELTQLQAMRSEALAWLEEKNLAQERANSLLALASDAQKNLPKMTDSQRARFVSLLDIRIYLEGPVPTRRGGHRCPVGKWYRESGRRVPRELTDALWESIEPMMPRPGRRGDTRRKSVETALEKAVTGKSWAVCAKAVGASAETAKEAWARWVADGTWERLDELLGAVERVEAYADAPQLPPFRIRGVADPRLLVANQQSCSGSSVGSHQGGFGFHLRLCPGVGLPV